MLFLRYSHVVPGVMDVKMHARYYKPLIVFRQLQDSHAKSRDFCIGKVIYIDSSTPARLDMEASRFVSNERDEQMLKLSLVVIIHTGELRCSSSFQHLGILEKFDPSMHRQNAYIFGIFDLTGCGSPEGSLLDLCHPCQC